MIAVQNSFKRQNKHLNYNFLTSASSRGGFGWALTDARALKNGCYKRAEPWKMQPISAYWNELQPKAEITCSCSFRLLFRSEMLSRDGINRAPFTLHTTWKIRSHHFISFDVIYSVLNKKAQNTREPVQQWQCWIKESKASKICMLTFRSKHEFEHTTVGTFRVILSSENDNFANNSYYNSLCILFTKPNTKPWEKVS